MPEEKNPVHTVVVGCLVRDGEGRILLIRHHRRGWEIPQGRVEEGENLVEALRREVREEAGVEIAVGPLACLWSKVDAPPALVFTFLGTYAGGDICCGTDSVDACWTTVDEALALVVGEVMRDRLRAALTFCGVTTYRAYAARPYTVHIERPLVVG